MVLLIPAMIVLLFVVLFAVILRAAVSLYNSLAGSSRTPDAIPEPSIGKALGVIIVVMIANAIADYTVGALIGGEAPKTPAEGAITARKLISLPVGVLVMSGLLAAMLPTTFVRSLIVTILFHVIAVVVTIALVFTFAMLMPAPR